MAQKYASVPDDLGAKVPDTLRSEGRVLLQVCKNETDEQWSCE